MSAYDFHKGRFVNLEYGVDNVVKCVEHFWNFWNKFKSDIDTKSKV